MPKVSFNGRVLPSAIKISIGKLPGAKWKDHELGLEMDFTISVQENIVTVECKLNKFNKVDHFATIYMRAFDLVRAAVDLVGFANGYGFIVILETFVDSEGTSTAICLNDSSLIGLCTAFDSSGRNFEAILKLVLEKPALFFALRQLMEAITLPHAASVNCARAIETLKHLLAGPGADGKLAWGEMRSKLNIDKNYLTRITEISIAPRHGDLTHIPGPVVTDVVRKSWAVMNRFLELKRRGIDSLPQNEFPILM